MRAWSEARYSGAGYDHLVYVASDCVAAISCATWTDVNPEPQALSIAPRRDGGGADVPRVSGFDVHPLPELRIEPPPGGAPRALWRPRAHAPAPKPSRRYSLTGVPLMVEIPTKALGRYANRGRSRDPSCRPKLIRSPPVFHLGDVLAGKYRIERILGVGGMGVVVAATHLQLDEQVAIKFLLPEAPASAEAVARFVREARAAVEDQERARRAGHRRRRRSENGAPYMVMEYLDGGDLSAWLRKRRGPLAVEDAVDYLLQACEAIAEAHALGIVHRDLKPANLFLTTRADGIACVKVLDFGISKTDRVRRLGRTWA